MRKILLGGLIVMLAAPAHAAFPVRADSIMISTANPLATARLWYRHGAAQSLQTLVTLGNANKQGVALYNDIFLKTNFTR